MPTGKVTSAKATGAKSATAVDKEVVEAAAAAEAETTEMATDTSGYDPNPSGNSDIARILGLEQGQVAEPPAKGKDNAPVTTPEEHLELTKKQPSYDQPVEIGSQVPLHAANLQASRQWNFQAEKTREVLDTAVRGAVKKLM